MSILRARAFVRAWPAGSQGPRPVAALVGIAECTADTELETIRGYAVMDAGGRALLSPTGHDGAFRSDVGNHDPSSILTQSDWPMPADETGLDGGGIALRLTRAPSPPGTMACILTGLFTGGTLRDQTMVDLVGDAAGILAIDGESCGRHLETNGSTLSQVLQRPLWGWTDDPWGVVSTMRLDVADACRRLDDLMQGDAEAYEGERLELERGPAGSVMRSGARDDEYGRFRRMYRETWGREPHEDVRNAARLDEHGRRVRDVVRAMRRTPLAA